MVRKEPKIITLDTETYNGLIGDLKRIAIYDGERVYYGYTFEDIEPILINYSLLYNVHIYIHNLEFDARKIGCIFDKSRIDWKHSLLINGKVAKIQCKKYCFHDSFKILPMSLSTLSGKKGFNVEHGKLSLFDAIQETYGNAYNIYDSGEIDENKTLVNFLDKCDKDDTLYLEYLGYDVISLYEVIQELLKVSGLSVGEFVKCVSTASMSRYIFKHGYNGKQFIREGYNKSDYEMLCTYKWDKDLDTEDFIRMSYCGGRTEVFKPILDKHGYHYDVNSLYPFVMMWHEYPIGKPRYTEEPALVQYMFESWMKNHEGLGFINCKVFIPDQPIPPLPVKMGKLCFPCGYVYGTWTYEELEYSIKECGVEIIEYYCGCHFDRTYPVFDNFIGTFYHLKEEATNYENYALRTISKLLMNLGYGYTGMRRDDKTSLDSIDNMNKHEKIVFADCELGFIEIPTEITSEYIQVQGASYVTSRARLVLLKALRDVIKRGGNVYYCDTDSIVSDIPFSDSIVDSAKLGFWDLEGQPEHALFLRPKVYVEAFQNEDDNIKFKGVSKETQKTLDYSFYEKLLSELKEGNKDYELVEKNKTLLRSIMYIKKNDLPDNYYETRDKKINLNTVEKRVIDYNENWTKPHYFNSIEEFEQFQFKPAKKEVQFDMTKGGHE